MTSLATRVRFLQPARLLPSPHSSIIHGWGGARNASCRANGKLGDVAGGPAGEVAHSKERAETFFCWQARRCQSIRWSGQSMRRNSGGHQQSRGIGIQSTPCGENGAPNVLASATGQLRIAVSRSESRLQRGVWIFLDINFSRLLGAGRGERR